MKSFTLKDYLLFVLPTTIWGTSWLVIKKFQVDSVAIDPMVSVGYRFLLAGVILWGGGQRGNIFKFFKLIVRGLFPSDGGTMRQRAAAHARYNVRKEEEGARGGNRHFFIILQGMCLFGVNYWLIYVASRYLTSGVVALTFSFLTYFNALNAVLWLKRPLSKQLLLLAGVGIIGLALLFMTELRAFELSLAKMTGLAFAFLGTYVASLGNILSARNQHHHISVLTATAYGMIYGGVMMLILAGVRGVSFSIPLTVPYLGAMVYLSLVASIIAFYSYLSLLGRIGPQRAAYTALVFPLIAIILSVLFENYVVNWNSLLGISLVLGVNFFMFRLKA